MEWVGAINQSLGFKLKDKPAGKHGFYSEDFPPNQPWEQIRLWNVLLFNLLSFWDFARWVCFLRSFFLSLISLTLSFSLSLSLSPVLKIIQQPQTRWKWCKSCKPGDWGQKLSFLCYGFIIPPVSIPGFTLLVERKTERKTASVVLTQWISELLLNHELNHWIS